QAVEVESAAPAAESDSDEISDDEFEALLDQLHGKGKFTPEVVSSTPAPANQPVESDSDEITDDEFEALLDQLHGKGKFDPTATGAAVGEVATGVTSAEAATDKAASESAESTAPEVAQTPVS